MSTPTNTPSMVIKPPGGWNPIDLVELWRYRDMLWRMTLRDIKSRYKQSVLGPTWVIVIPIVQTLIFTLVFGLLLGAKPEEENASTYMVKTHCGMVVWLLFARAFTQTCSCIIANEALITKVYFPRLIAPLASTFGSILDLLLGLVVLVVLMLYAGVDTTANIVYAPLFILLAMVAAMSVGVWIAVLSVRYRDLRYASQNFRQFLLYLTPVAYPAAVILDNAGVSESVRPTFEVLFQLNPMYVVVEGFRWSVIGHADGAPTTLSAISVAITLALLIAGLFYFRRVDSTVADIV